MSMFDDVRILDDDAAMFPCAAGHPQRAFQTKDLDDPVQATYYLKGRKLYMADGPRRRGIRFVDRAARELETRVDGETLFLTTRTLRTASLVPHTGVAHIYTYCTTCRTIVYTAPTISRALRDRGRREVQEVAPDVEYKIKLVEGELVKSKATRIETRDQVVKELRAQGLRVLEDDDHLARRHRGELDDKELQDERDQDW